MLIIHFCCDLSSSGLKVFFFFSVSRKHLHANVGIFLKINKKKFGKRGKIIKQMRHTQFYVNEIRCAVDGISLFITVHNDNFNLINFSSFSLQSKIAVLLGERKGLQTTHSDLIRRIKMLEYALRQERIKFHRLKFGCDPPTVDLTQSPDDTGLANELVSGERD